MSGSPSGSLRVRVVPRAARNTIARDPSGGLRVHLSAPPAEGAANRALIELFAARLRVPKRAVTIVRGERSRDKQVVVDGVSPAEVERRLSDAAATVDTTTPRGYRFPDENRR